MERRRSGEKKKNHRSHSIEKESGGHGSSSCSSAEVRKSSLDEIVEKKPYDDQ